MRIGDQIGSEYNPDTPYTSFREKKTPEYESLVDKVTKELFGSKEDFSGEQPTWTPNHDLLKPPGLVGQVTEYINSQCRYPRENLAVISAIVAVGNMGGLYHRIKDNKLTSNLFAFCVAGSATGKEAVLQAVNDLHIEAGMAAAIHGSIKSEQEIVRNLIRHQAAFYIIDELGIFMRKLNMSHKTGGASYLQGVIGMLMAAYSKGNGNLLLSGDVKEEIKAGLNREYAALQKRADEGDSVDDRLEAIKNTIINIDNGLKNPFLSMIGFSTPSTFNECVSFEQVTSGFIGRSLIINEPDTNPKRKRGFIQPDMPQSLIDKIQSLTFSDSYNSATPRIESGSSYKYITTTPEAQRALEESADWFEDEAEKHTERTGFEAVVRRGYEMVEKISFILSIGSTTRGLEAVEWANEYIRRDIEYKTLLAYSNVKEKVSPVESMAAKILCSLDHNGISVGRLMNKYRVKRDLVDDAVAFLERKDKIYTENRLNRYNKSQSLIIFAK